MTGWRVWCPVCRRHRQTRIPAEADTRTVTAAYDPAFEDAPEEQGARQQMTCGNGGRHAEREFERVSHSWENWCWPGLRQPRPATHHSDSTGRGYAVHRMHAPHVCEPSRAVNHTGGAS